MGDLAQLPLRDGTVLRENRQDRELPDVRVLGEARVGRADCLHVGEPEQVAA